MKNAARQLHFTKNKNRMTNITNHRTQLKTIFHYLQNSVATGSMVSKATGVPQKCFTRYKRDLEKTGRLMEIKKTVCEVTGFKAWYVTCDEALFPSKNQLKLF